MSIVCESTHTKAFGETFTYVQNNNLKSLCLEKLKKKRTETLLLQQTAIFV